ncbi:MAG: hypothetical protein QM804_12755 [Propionicimonas sp.]
MRIPDGFTHLRTERHEQADLVASGPSRVAEVEVYADAEGVEFVLVPGAAKVVLGWDRGFAPLDDPTRQGILDDLERVVDPLTGYTKWRAELDPEADPDAAAWLDERIEAARADGPPELDERQRHLFSPEGYAEHINNAMSPVRAVSIPTLLVERRPRVIGWHPIGSYHLPSGESRLQPGHEDVIARALDTLRTIGTDGVQINRLGRFQREPDGWWRVERQVPTSRADLVAGFGQFRLPTEDEWEYLAGAGGRTLFRWGDGLPEDTSSLGYGAEPNLLEAPNLNGLVIGWDQFVFEVVAEPGLRKGGDGGGTMHDGLGAFDMMLPLATAFRALREDENDLSGGYNAARRVIEV